jgi:hypothetical protein
MVEYSTSTGSLERRIEAPHLYAAAGAVSTLWPTVQETVAPTIGPQKLDRLIRSKMECVHCRPGSSPDLPPDLCLVPIRPQRSKAVFSKPLASSARRDAPGIRWQTDPQRRAGHGPSSGSRAAAIDPSHNRRRPPTAIVLSARCRNDPLDANHTQSQVSRVSVKVRRVPREAGEGVYARR